MRARALTHRPLPPRPAEPATVENHRGIRVVAPDAYAAVSSPEALRIDAAEGWETPALAGHWRRALDFFPVTSGSFTDCYRTRWHTVHAKVLVTTVPWSCPAGTTGEFRLHSLASATTTDVFELTSGGSGNQEFRWLHGATLGATPLVVAIEARRTSGGGTIGIFEPDYVYQVGPTWITGESEGGIFVP